MKRIFCIILCTVFFFIPAFADELKTSSSLEYDALISDPDVYSGEVYYVAGDVIRAYNLSNENVKEDRDMILISIDGDSTRPAYIAYPHKEGETPFSFGNRIWARVVFENTMSTQTTLGFYVTLPLFYSFSTPIIQK